MSDLTIVRLAAVLLGTALAGCTVADGLQPSPAPKAVSKPIPSAAPAAHKASVAPTVPTTKSSPYIPNLGGAGGGGGGSSGGGWS